MTSVQDTRKESIMLKRTRTIGATSALLGGALLLSACGGQTAQNSAAALENPGADTARSDTAQGGTPPEATHNNNDIGTTSCDAEDFKLDLNAQPQQPGEYLLALTNNSGKPCDVGGWVNFTGQGFQAGQEFQIPTEKVEVPGPVEDFQLQPGRTAFAGVKFNVEQNAEYHATGFRATADKLSGSTDVNLIGTNGQPADDINLPIKSIQIGTLQQTSQGVQL